MDTCGSYNPCNPNPCKNGGKCINPMPVADRDRLQCICPITHYGELCEHHDTPSYTKMEGVKCLVRGDRRGELKRRHRRGDKEERHKRMGGNVEVKRRRMVSFLARNSSCDQLNSHTLLMFICSLNNRHLWGVFFHLVTSTISPPPIPFQLLEYQIWWCVFDWGNLNAPS